MTLAPVYFATKGYVTDSQGNQVNDIEPDRTVTFQIDSAVTEFNLTTKDNVANASLVLGTGSAGVGSLVGAGLVAEGPGGWLALALAAAAGGASYASGQLPAPTSDVKVSNYAEYKADIKFQKLINDARAADPNAYPNEKSRCDDSLQVDAAAAEIDRVAQTYPGDQQPWEHDAFFGQINGTMRCKASAGRFQKADFYKGDEYGKNGYVGHCYLQVNRPQDVFYLFNWTYTPNTAPPPQPTP